MGPSSQCPGGICAPVCELFMLKEPCTSRCSTSAQALGAPQGWVHCEKSQQKSHLLIPRPHYSILRSQPRASQSGLRCCSPPLTRVGHSQLRHAGEEGSATVCTSPDGLPQGAEEAPPGQLHLLSGLLHSRCSRPSPWKAYERCVSQEGPACQCCQPQISTPRLQAPQSPEPVSLIVKKKKAIFTIKLLINF